MKIIRRNVKGYSLVIFQLDGTKWECRPLKYDAVSYRGVINMFRFTLQMNCATCIVQGTAGVVGMDGIPVLLRT